MHKMDRKNTSLRASVIALVLILRVLILIYGKKEKN